MKKIFYAILISCFISSFLSCRFGSNRIFGYIQEYDSISLTEYPVSNAAIEIINQTKAKTITTTTTDENGWYDVTRLSSGIYVVHAYIIINGIKHEATSQEIILDGGNESGETLLLQ